MAQQVTTLHELLNLCYQKRSVIIPNGGNFASPRPAAFMINLSGAILARLMRQGMYVYERKANGVKP